MDIGSGEKIFRAYRNGLLHCAPVSVSCWPNFDCLLHQLLWCKLPPRERLIVRRAWDVSTKGLLLSRNRQWAAALALFDACWKELDKDELSSTAKLLAAFILASRHAYFEYKQGNYDLARARIHHAMDAALWLEHDKDFSLLELHRLQSVQNLMRIDFCAGQPRRAVALGGQVLAYLEGFRERLPIHSTWFCELLRTRTPRPIRRVLIPQIANEVALAFARFPAIGLEEEFLANVELDRYRSARQVLHQQFRLWLLTKQAFHDGDRKNIQDLLVEFLPMGRTDLQTIWYSTVIDLLKMCRDTNDQISRFVHDGILRDAPKWPGLPSLFRPLVGLSLLSEENGGAS